MKGARLDRDGDRDDDRKKIDRAVLLEDGDGIAGADGAAAIERRELDGTEKCDDGRSDFRLRVG